MPNTLSIGVAYSDQAMSGGSIDNSPIGATTASTIAGTTIYASSEIGYSNGAQGTVTQLTSKSTGVTLSKSSGQITMSNAALSGATAVSFILTNTTISAKDVLIVNIGSNTTGSLAGDYTTYVSYLAAGSALITLRNLSAATPYSEAVVINFAIIHGA